MAFRPHCPKCGSYNISLDKDVGGGWGTSQVMLHCTCGKSIYGEDTIMALHASQLSAWEADKESRKAEVTAEVERTQQVQQQDLTVQTHREHMRQRRQRAEDEKEQQRLANVAWAVEARERRRAETHKPAPRSPMQPEPATCAWTPCENLHTAKSKYCSVACKNKNARHRHKARKRAKEGE
jgi:hypothetical protein